MDFPGKGEIMEKKREKKRMVRGLLFLLLFCICSSWVQGAGGDQVIVNNERGMKYPSAWGKHATHYYTVTTDKGEFIAYCLEPARGQIPSGGYAQEELVGNDDLGAALYYGYGGPGQGEYLDQVQFTDLGSTSEEDAKYILSHLAVSYFYDPSDAFYGMSQEQIENTGVMEFIHWLEGKKPPSINSWFSQEEIQASFDKEQGVQRTETMEYLSDREDNQLTIPCPEGVILHNQTTGEEGTGEVTVKAGDSFYFSAPLDIGNTVGEVWKAEDLKGNQDGSWKVMKIPSAGEHQDSGYGFYSQDKAGTIGFQIHWIAPVTLELQKLDAETGEPSPQGKGSIEGAEYTVYAAEDIGGWKKDTPIGKILTDAEGRGSLSGLFPGKYHVKETKAPTGYFLDGSVYEIDLTENLQEKICSIVSKEKPVRGSIELYKTDKETGGNAPQVHGTSFAGTVYEILADEDIGALKKGEKAGEIITDEKGYGRSEELLMGRYRVKEIKAPQGYLPDQEEYVVEIPQDREGGADLVVKVKSKEQPIRGDLSITKFLQENDGDSEKKKPGEGIGFTITEVGNEHNSLTITTDENGLATTRDPRYPEGRLLYGTYRITETKTPSAYTPIQPFTVTISQENQSLYFIIENQEVLCPLTVVKIAEDTGKVIARAGTSFKIQKKMGEKWEDQEFLVSLYPQELRQTIFETDETGSFHLPQKLKAGQYRLVEIRPPMGYGKNTEPLEFTVENGMADAHGLELRFSDKPQTGRLKIRKLDEDTGKAVGEGFVFSIKAAEDIMTADGTLRSSKGEEVDKIATDAEGKAVSRELYPGNYLVEELQVGEYYGIEKEGWQIRVEADSTEENFVVDIELKNKKTQVEIIKTEEGKEDVFLEGARFRLYREKELGPEELENLGEVLPEKGQQIITDQKGKAIIEDLEHDQTYYLVEEQAPEGYLRSTQIYDFHVDEQGLIQGNRKKTIEISDRPKPKGYISVIKKDSSSKENLGEGFSFEIHAAQDIFSYTGERMYKEGDLVEVISTDKNGIAKSTELFPGKYLVGESRSGEYYALDKRKYETEIQATEDGQIHNGEIEIENEKTSFFIEKKEKEQGKPMEQVVFAVAAQEDWEKEAGKKAEVDRELLEKYGKRLTTDQEGRAWLQELKHNSTYYVTELQTREGYLLDETIYSFQVDEKGWIQGKSDHTLKLVNEKKPEEGKTSLETKSPVRTGDESSLTFWGIVLGFSVAALLILVGKQRKNRRS